VWQIKERRKKERAKDTTVQSKSPRSETLAQIIRHWSHPRRHKERACSPLKLPQSPGTEKRPYPEHLGKSTSSGDIPLDTWRNPRSTIGGPPIPAQVVERARH
jgi:hypothetical protein